MKVLFDSYNRCTQNNAGGVQSKIFDLYNSIRKKNVEISLFNKWSDKMDACDIFHLFSLSYENFSEVDYLKHMGKKIVVSSIVPLSGKIKIQLNIAFAKYFKAHTLVSINKAILDYCDAIVAETSKEKAFLADAYNIEPSKIYVIPNGVSPAVLNGDANIFREKYHEYGDFVIQVGRIDRNKNLLSVIKAISDTNIPLYVIGGPVKGQMNYYEECKKIAGKNVHFLGWIKHSDPMLSSILRAAKVLVLPSFEEIFGNAMFEALANGTNVVASNVLPVDEWGLSSVIETIDPYDISDIRNKILSSLKKDIIPETEMTILKQFSFDSIASQHLELYNSLLKK